MSHDIAQKLRAMLAEVEGDRLDHVVQDVTDAFRRHVLPTFKHNGGQYNRFWNLLLLLDDEYCDVPIRDFGPVKLQVIRRILVSRGGTRRYVNEQVRSVIQIFRFGVSRELVRPDQLVALRSVQPLKYGQAREGKRRKVVTIEQVRATYAELSPMLQSMLTIQLGTGCRPGEVFAIRPVDVDRTGDVWVYRPDRHKTRHHGIEKAIPIIGDARDALTPYLLRDECELCFHTRFGNPWNRDAYRHEVHKAAQRAGVSPWSPSTIRHLAAQAVRERAGLEAAKSLLGHRSSIVTEQHYAATTESEAIEAAKLTPRIG